MTEDKIKRLTHIIFSVKTLCSLISLVSSYILFMILIGHNVSEFQVALMSVLFTFSIIGIGENIFDLVVEYGMHRVSSMRPDMCRDFGGRVKHSTNITISVKDIKKVIIKNQGFVRMNFETFYKYLFFQNAYSKTVHVFVSKAYVVIDDVSYTLTFTEWLLLTRFLNSTEKKMRRFMKNQKANNKD